MAKYKTHTTFNILIALPLILWGLYHYLKPSYSLLSTFSICFIYSTLFMNPDMDIANKIKLFSIKGILTLPFRGYSYVFRHRGISHWIILGSITRILWLSGFLYLIILLLNKPLLHQKEVFLLINSDYFLYGFLAIVASDASHLILDIKKS